MLRHRHYCDVFGVAHTILSDDALLAMTSTIRVFLSWRRRLETLSLFRPDHRRAALNDFMKLQDANHQEMTGERKEHD